MNLDVCYYAWAGFWLDPVVTAAHLRQVLLVACSSMQRAQQLHVGFQGPAGLSIWEVAHIVTQPPAGPAGDGFCHILSRAASAKGKWDRAA